MKVKTDYLGCPYITAGKEYDVFDISPNRKGGRIIDDEGDITTIHFSSSSHIGENKFEIIEGEKS